jgi:hypothetical protein
MSEKKLIIKFETIKTTQRSNSNPNVCDLDVNLTSCILFVKDMSYLNLIANNKID